MTLSIIRSTSGKALAVELETLGLLAAAFEGALHVGILAAERKLVISAISVILLGVDGAVDSGDKLARAQLEPARRVCSFLSSLRPYPQEEVC
jgi:hypothetical protein